MEVCPSSVQLKLFLVYLYPVVTTIALTKGQHDSTKQVYREWLKEKTGKPVGGKVAWEEIYPHEIFKLSEDMFDAAGVPQYARDEYYKEFNKYIYTNFGGYYGKNIKRFN